MKTDLPKSIQTVEEAQSFLRELHSNNESYHPEDSAHLIVWKTIIPTEEEKNQLDKLMLDIYELPEVPQKFDPCEFLLNLIVDTKSEKFEPEGFSETTFVKSARTENTGGNVMVDFLKLEDGRLLAISIDGIGLYRNMDHFDGGEEPLSYMDR